MRTSLTIIGVSLKNKTFTCGPECNDVTQTFRDSGARTTGRFKHYINKESLWLKGRHDMDAIPAHIFFGPKRDPGPSEGSDPNPLERSERSGTLCNPQVLKGPAGL